MSQKHNVELFGGFETSLIHELLEDGHFLNEIIEQWGKRPEKIEQLNSIIDKWERPGRFRTDNDDVKIVVASILISTFLKSVPGTVLKNKGDIK